MAGRSFCLHAVVAIALAASRKNALVLITSFWSLTAASMQRVHTCSHLAVHRSRPEPCMLHVSLLRVSAYNAAVCAAAACC